MIPTLHRPALENVGRARRRIGRRRELALGLLLAAHVSAQTAPAPATAAASGTEPANNIVELSPFVVNSGQDLGYRATTTLAGTRLNTELKDVGAAVSVYTQEFLEDIAVTKLEDILSYTTSTEGAGPNGNFSGIVGENSAEVRDDPSAATRVRALAQATRTRDFFASDIPSDTYNQEALTISRGPNAILAGVGNAGGVIDSTLRKATFNDGYRIVSRFGEHDSHREEVHLNKVIIPKRLALRLDLLNDETNFRQDPAYAKDQRLYAAVQYRVFEPARRGLIGRGTFRANYEKGRIEGVPPDPLTPVWTVDSWFNATNPKWRVDGARQLTQNAAGATIANNAVTQGFPIFRNWALVFANPTSDTPGIGLGGSLSAVQGFMGTIPGGAQGPGGFLRGSGDPNRVRAGFARTHLSNRNVFNFYDQLLTGAFDYREQRFDAMDLRYEQLLLGGKAGFELAYNDQSFKRQRDFPIAGGDEAIYIDVNSVLSIRSPEFPNGIPNPNFGRPFISTQDAFRDQLNRTEREAMQLTAFFRHDFARSRSAFARWLGRHTVSALAFQTDIERFNRTYRSTWDPAGQLNPVTSIGAAPGTFASQVNAWFYLGGSMLGANTVDDIRLQAISTGRPQYGQTYTLRVFDPGTRNFVTGTSTPLRVLARAVDQREELRSTAFALQSHWLKDHIVTVVGWREDRDEAFTSITPPLLPNGGLDESRITYQPAVTQSKQSWTKSVVARLPLKLPGETEVRAFWNDSGNFNPVGQRRNIWNEELGSPSAETREIGVSLATFRGKFDLRVNRYRTRIESDAVGGVGNPYSYISGLITRMLGARDLGLNPAEFGYVHPSFRTFSDVALGIYETIPARLKANIGTSSNFNPRFTGSGPTLQWNPDVITNLASVSDTESTGTEFEAIVNPTSSWRISLSVAKNEAVKSSVASQELAFANAWRQNLETMYNGALLQGARNPPTENTPFWPQYSTEHLGPIRTAAALSGTATPEIRKWRANVVTRYEFRQGFLRGVNIGGALRWQDRVAIGYPFVTNAAGESVADITRPYWGPSDTQVDLRLGYTRKLKVRGAPVTWSINLNLRNLNAKDELIPIAANADGTWGTFRIPPERTWNVTNSLAF